MEEDVTPERLRELRRRLGAREGTVAIGQAELARRIGANKVTVWRWEQGKAVPRGIARKALAMLMADVGMKQEERDDA